MSNQYPVPEFDLTTSWLWISSTRPGLTPSEVTSLYIFIFVFSIQLTVNVQYNFWPMTWFGPLELEVTALPTEQQPLPY